MAEVLVTIAVTVELIQDIGNLPGDLVGQGRLSDEQGRIQGRPRLAPRDGRNRSS